MAFNYLSYNWYEMRRAAVIILLWVVACAHANETRTAFGYSEHSINHLVEQMFGRALTVSHSPSRNSNLEVATLGKPHNLAISSSAKPFLPPPASSLLRSRSSLIAPQGWRILARPGRPARRIITRAKELTEENIEEALGVVRKNWQLKIVYATPLHREMGLNGDVELVEVDGPRVIVSLKGKFDDERELVMERLTEFLCQNFPDISSVEVEDPSMLEEANNVWEDGDTSGIQPAPKVEEDALWFREALVGGNIDGIDGDDVGSQVGSEEEIDGNKEDYRGSGTYEAPPDQQFPGR